MTEAQAYIESLGKELQIDIALSASGAVAFDYEGRIILLQWNELQHSFIVYVELGYLEGFNDEQVCKTLLSANFLLMDSAGGCLSYDEHKNMVGFNYELSLFGLSNQEFILKLNAIVLLADKWKDKFTAIKNEHKKLISEQLAHIDEEENLNNITTNPNFLSV